VEAPPPPPTGVVGVRLVVAAEETVDRLAILWVVAAEEEPADESCRDPLEGLKERILFDIELERFREPDRRGIGVIVEDGLKERRSVSSCGGVITE
jgi:hypothetical protein